MKKEFINKLKFQFVYPVEGKGKILEILDEKEDAFMQVSLNEDTKEIFTIFDHAYWISFPLDELTKIIELAKDKLNSEEVD